MRGIYSVCIGGMFLAGCMTARVQESTSPLTEQEASRKAIIEEASNSKEIQPTRAVIGPKWKHVNYRGRVVTEGDQAGAPWVVVSIFEGEERLFTTLTDPEGHFELPADLYGLEIRRTDGSRGWIPEEYYEFRVDAGDKGESTQDLDDLRLDERIVLYVD